MAENSLLDRYTYREGAALIDSPDEVKDSQVAIVALHV